MALPDDLEYVGIPVLNHGFVALVDRMGSDSSIVQAARVSYGAGTKTVREDAKLLDYLWKNQHGTPFEMVELKFLVRLPIFIARQWVRHRTANINEYSMRYSEALRLYYVPDVSRIQGQHATNRQGSGEALSLDKRDAAHSIILKNCERGFADYDMLLSLGVSREIARGVLNVYTYTEWYWKCDLRNIFNFLALRLDSHAQWEIQQYAKAVAHFIRDTCPMAWETFVTHTLKGVDPLEVH